ncbi:MAG: hypothetical protein IJS90_09170, partial [Clostridia bacterium]|nr:hypothetical protein [Clostridia bacterium]
AYSLFSFEIPNVINEKEAREKADSVNDSGAMTFILSSKEELSDFLTLLQEQPDFENESGFFETGAIIAVLLPGFDADGADNEKTALVHDGEDIVFAIFSPKENKDCAAVFFAKIKQDELNKYSSYKTVIYTEGGTK